jgi:hypothetical protein
MNAPKLIHISRTCGVLFGALAAVTVITALDSLFGLSYTSSLPLHSAPAILLLLAAALLRASYLAWFSWSPLAIRHIIGTLFFFLTIWLICLAPLSAAFVFPVCYATYRFIAWRLSRYAFSADTHATPSSNTRQA